MTLNNELVEVDTYKALMRSMLLLFYPDAYRDSDDVRGAMEGTGGLLDTAALRRFRDTKTAIELVSDIGMARVDRFQAEWGKLPETVRRSGSVSSSVAYAMMRLNTIYKRFFAVPVSVEEPSDPLEQSDSETEAITTSAASP